MFLYNDFEEKKKIMAEMGATVLKEYMRYSKPYLLLFLVISLVTALLRTCYFFEESLPVATF